MALGYCDNFNRVIYKQLMVPLYSQVNTHTAKHISSVKAKIICKSFFIPSVNTWLEGKDVWIRNKGSSRALTFLLSQSKLCIHFLRLHLTPSSRFSISAPKKHDIRIHQKARRVVSRASPRKQGLRGLWGTGASLSWKYVSSCPFNSVLSSVQMTSSRNSPFKLSDGRRKEG